MNNIIYIIILFITVLFSQNQNIVIDEIEVRGNEMISDYNIKFISKLESGTVINNYHIQNAIERLWSTGRYLDVRIEIEKIIVNRLVIFVVEAPPIKEIIFKGNKKNSDKKLLEEFGLSKNNFINYSDIQEGVNRLLAFYKEKNYHNISIDYAIDDILIDGQKFNNIVFSIDEGNKLKLKKINISGNQKYSDRKIIKQFKETSAQKWYLPWKGKFDYEKYIDDKFLLKNFYYNNGYKDFQITNENINYGDKEIILELTIDEGPQYFIGNISWINNSLKPDSLLNDIANLQLGSIYNQQLIDYQVVESVKSLYMNEGFLNFNLKPVVKPSLDEENQLDIDFILSEGDIFTIKDIMVSGNKKTDENVIRRELDIYPGDKFSRNKLIQSVTDLWMLNFFDDVQPRIIPISDNEISVELVVSEKGTGQANFTMGYNQVHGFQGGGGFQFPNFMGKGQNLSIQYQRGLSGGGVNQNSLSSYSTSTNQFESYSVSFFDPSLFDTPNSVGVSLSHSERGQNQSSFWPFDTDNFRASLRFGRRKLKWPDRYFKISWSATYSEDRSFSSNLSDLTSYWGSSISPYVEYSNSQYYFSTIGVSISQTISRDSRNRPEFPTFGSKIKFQSTLSGSALGGDHDYLKNTFEINVFKSILDKLVVSQEFKIGSLNSIGAPSDQRSVIPISARYFMGGSGMSYGEMLRGYRENSIGPYDYRPRGGNLMLKYSLELRWSFSTEPTVYGFLFADMGNVWSDYDIIKITDLKRSAGIGIRLFMPMLGTLGYDIGYGFDDTIFDVGRPHGWEHHFIFGMPIN